MRGRCDRLRIAGAEASNEPTVKESGRWTDRGHRRSAAGLDRPLEHPGPPAAERSDHAAGTRRPEDRGV